VTVEPPLPRALKLFHAADVEPFKPTEAEDYAEDYRGEIGRQLAAVEDWAAKRAAGNKEFKVRLRAAVPSQARAFFNIKDG
jgi:hypothetical protein